MRSNTFRIPSFLDNCTSIQISIDHKSSDIKYIQKPGLMSGSGVEGFFPIYDTSSNFVNGKKPKPLATKDLLKLGKDKEIARVHIKCASHFKRDYDVKVVAANGTVIAQFKRSAGATLLNNRGKAVEMPVLVPVLQEDEAPGYGTEAADEMMEIGSCTFHTTGHPQMMMRNDSSSGDGVGTLYEINRPFCNFHTAMCCLGFLLFIPTFAIGTCVTFGCAMRKPVKHYMQRTGMDGRKTDLNPLLVKSENTHVDFNNLPTVIGGDGRPQETAKEKFSIMIFAIVNACEVVIDPPSSPSV